MSEASVLTRREIMKILPEIRSQSRFRVLCKYAGITHVGERREKHVNTYLYSIDAIEKLKVELAYGDRRSWK